MTKPDLTTFALGDFMTNCHIVTVPSSPKCWIVDCGYAPESLFAHIDAQKLEPIAILLTHAHADHIASLDMARQKYGDIPVYLHEAEKRFCSDPMLNLSAMLGAPVSVAEPDHWLSGGETLELEGTTWRVLHTPGHSPGCVCFIHDDSKTILAGDTLFEGSIGRIDFPTSDPVAMKRTIQETMMALDDDMIVHPGHGPSTTIGRERVSNPFVLGMGW